MQFYINKIITILRCASVLMYQGETLQVNVRHNMCKIPGTENLNITGLVIYLVKVLAVSHSELQ